MTGNNIKKRIDELVKIREDAVDEIDKLQKECDHSKTYKGIYSWRVACFQEYWLCKYCHYPVKPTGKWDTTFQTWDTTRKLK